MSAWTSGQLGGFSSVLLVPQQDGHALSDLNSVKVRLPILTQNRVATFQVRQSDRGLLRSDCPGTTPNLGSGSGAGAYALHSQIRCTAGYTAN